MMGSSDTQLSGEPIFFDTESVTEYLDSLRKNILRLTWLGGGNNRR